jgi:hypothetical protein
MLTELESRELPSVVHRLRPRPELYRPTLGLQHEERVVG